MFSLTQYMISHSVPQETLVLLLTLPILITIIVFARQIIGMKGFGIYTPLIISIAFVATGLKYGLTFFCAILIIGTLTRVLLKKIKVRLLYLPRIGIIIIAVVVAILGIVFAGSYFNHYELTNTSVLAILIMITMVEKFLVAQIKRGPKETIVLTIEMLFLSIVCYTFVQWNLLKDVVLHYPLFVIGFSLLANIALGKWTGLRLYEYLRFQELISRIDLPEKK